MECLVNAFALFTHCDPKALMRDMGHPPPYHIQEIVEQIAPRWAITEIFSGDIDPDCPYPPERIERWMEKHSGVVAKWSNDMQMHAWVWNHKSKIVQDNTGYSLPKYPYNILWIVSPRIF